MKRIFAIATALCFAMPSLALAQQDHRGKPGPANKPPMTKPAFGAKPVGPQKPPGNINKPKPPPNNHKPQPPQHRPPAVKPPPGNHKPQPPQHRPPMVKPPKPRPPSWRPPQWHKPRAAQWYWRGKWVNRVHGPAFHYPVGWSYRYWTIGDILPGLFLSSAYYYDNVRPLGLRVPPPGYRWVRYGPDLLLVNLRTGSVEQVAYGVFY
jgi:Ni/Co efflux regulator RcnB